MPVIIIIIITVGTFSGCIQNKIDYSKIGIKPNFNSKYINIGDSSGGNILVSFQFNFPSITNAGVDYKEKEIVYVLYGNGHYVGGGKINSSYNIGQYEWQYLHILNTVDTNDGYEIVWLIDINQELKSALLNQQVVNWTVTGKYSFYPSNNSELVTVPFEDSCIQTQY